MRTSVDDLSLVWDYGSREITVSVQGDAAHVVVAADDELVLVGMGAGLGVNRHAAAQAPDADNDIVAVDYDAR